ncbi:MAG: hypothetical protein HKN51_07370 [Saprospiraceae bacterium]|nr:hypothetical protein [Saprospiraceae bacterium]
MKVKIALVLRIAVFCGMITTINAQEHSIARVWNEEVLNGIRNDFARPTVHARNLWHTSIAMYDIWAVYHPEADPYLLGNTVNGIEIEFDGIPVSSTPEADIEEAISYAIYRLLFNRFLRSPGAGSIFGRMNQIMIDRGYSLAFSSTDYSSGNPAALGNYVAEKIIEFGDNDNSNQANDYANIAYEPVNDPLLITESGVMPLNDPNRWQPLTLEEFIDQSGNVTSNDTPDFLSPEWGQVTPFALSTDDLMIYQRDGFDYYVYHDPGTPPQVSLEESNAMSDQFKWGFAMVSIWSSHLDPDDGVMWDISPGAIGNVNELPTDFTDYPDFYNYIDGGDIGEGHEINPYTGEPYEPNMVPRGDYGRVLAEFWADGPDSETPPGHWFTLLNYVTDHPAFERKYNGKGEQIDLLEWDVKSYLMMGSAMHDCAIAAWGIKGYYDYLRPISAIRSMAGRGQCTDENLPNYHVGGMPLVEGYIELVEEGDPLVGPNLENLNKIKLYAWKGPEFIEDPEVDVAGVDWILADDWWPYQRPSFVTPPFAGYVSGHSTYSRAAADLLAHMTGSEFFPGGMAEFSAERNEFLVFEDGPSEDIILQWATFRDASDQTSLSRIWGGIHPPADDIPGRLIGIEIAKDVISKAESFLFDDVDNDGFYTYQDCDDTNPNINPAANEICDGRDNNCSGFIDDNLPLFTYYLDVDSDGYGDEMFPIDTCLLFSPSGYASNPDDCNDEVDSINPISPEICDAIDNNCDGRADEGLPRNRYYFDFDNDGFGDASIFVDTCIITPPVGFVDNLSDCNDMNELINPNASEICDAIDNNCDGRADEGLTKNRYYEDLDQDGFGNQLVFADTCILIPPVGFVDNSSDCDDSDNSINPDGIEICDAVDNNCDGKADEGLPKFTYYLDSDNDGFGNLMMPTDTCIMQPPIGYVDNSLDCDDSNSGISPIGIEIPDNDIDEDCNGIDLFIEAKMFPNPFDEELRIHLNYDGEVNTYIFESVSGRRVHFQRNNINNNFFTIRNYELFGGVYFLVIRDTNGVELYSNTIVHVNRNF